MAGRTLTIDCTTCPVQHVACDGCLVTALDGLREGRREPLPLDPREREVVLRLVAAGLVTAETATRARARREPWSAYGEVGDAADEVG